MAGETPSSSSSTSKTAPQEQFLLKVLSRIGRSSLPYKEKDKSLIFEHLISLTKAYPSMRIYRAEYFLNLPTKILCASGSIPMVYQNVTYHLPVAVWLTKLYPGYAPHVYVCPTSDMVIKRNHSFVNPRGFLTIGYLRNWVCPTSNLVDLCRNLSEAFALDPPLHLKRKPDPNRSFGSAYLSVSNILDKLRNEFFKMLQTEGWFMEKICGDVDKFRKEYLELFQTNPLFSKEADVLEKRLQTVLNFTYALRATVSNGTWMSEGGDVEGLGCDEVYGLSDEILDVLSKHILECTASDLALGNVINSIVEKLLEERKISLDVYLNIVRLLSRLQFVDRAKSVKAYAALTRMASMAHQ